MNKKGANVIFTSIMIILLSVLAMIIIVGLVIPFFNNLREEIKFNQNKENLILINKELVELQNQDINTYKNLNLDVSDEIVFDATTNTVYIKQKINADSFKKFKDVNYGNLSITKGNGLMLFTLDVNGITTFEKSFVINTKNALKLEVATKNNKIPIISIKEYAG